MTKCVSADWIDLPKDNYVAILGYESPNVLRLNQLIHEYNQFQKDQENTLSDRVKELSKISDFLNHWIENELSEIDKKKHLVLLLAIVQSKLEYLSQLHKIYAEKKHEKHALEAYHFDTGLLEDKSKRAVFLNNARYFSIKMREYWGDFWLESLDPCHRRLTPFYEQWEKAKEAAPNIPHFFLWLETQHLPKYVPRVHHLLKEELENHRLIVKDGKLHQKGAKGHQLAHFADPLRRYLFAIDLKKELYVAEEAQGISHSSFTSGRPVLGAGLMVINQGELTGIALESGHYLPSIEIGQQIIQILHEKGLNFSDFLEIAYFYDRNKFIASVQKEDLLDIERLKRSLENARLSKTKCLGANV